MADYKKIVVAIGGNSLIRDGVPVSVQSQYEAICETVSYIAELIEKGHSVVVTHGNGPQVGYILRRSEIAAAVENVHTVPLVNCDADTQGAIGYQIQQALDNEFRKRNLIVNSGSLKRAVTIITQVEVYEDDSAFKNPSKPIGSFYSEDEIEEIKARYPDWHIIEDASRGYRRVVPSPKPKDIVEIDAIKCLLDSGFCVVAVGGGGIPVINRNNTLIGIDAVIDKDFASSLLAHKIGADLLIISTAVDKVYLNFGQENQRGLEVITIDELKRYKEEGHFAKGSMLPKIEAAIWFIERGGKEVIITKPELLDRALMGSGVTRIVK